MDTIDKIEKLRTNQCIHDCVRSAYGLKNIFGSFAYGYGALGVENEILT